MVKMRRSTYVPARIQTILLIASYQVCFQLSFNHLVNDIQSNRRSESE